MQIRQTALWITLAVNLTAQDGEPGYKWLGFQAGTTSFDTQTNLKASPAFGVQGGWLFEQRRYGLRFEGLLSHPKSDLLPGRNLNHTEFSAALLSGLSGDAASRFWPYVGLGLGAISVPKVDPATLDLSTVKAATAHASLGFLHRPVASFIWGVEGRYLFTFANSDLKEIQATAMVGFSWGSPSASRRSEPDPAPAETKTPPPPAEPIIVVTVPPPPVVPAPAPVPMASPAAVPVPMASAPPQPPPPPVVSAPAPIVVQPPAPAPAPVAPAPVPAPVPAPSPAPRGTSDSERTRRLDALRLGDMPKALDLGRKRIEAIPANHWTIRLEIASLPATLKNAVVAFPKGEPDLFIAPIKLKGGKTAYQLFLGDYPSKAEAERAAKTVPAFFLEGGQRPKPYLGAGIPTQ